MGALQNVASSAAARSRLQARRGQEALDLISGLKSQEADVQARRLNAGLKTQGADQIRKLKNR
jgi:hypothetical protein